MPEKIPRAQPPPAPPRLRRVRPCRCNPLRRRIDLLRSRLGLAVAVAVLATAPVAMVLVGESVDGSLRTKAREQAESRHRATAVLVHDAPQHPEPGSDEAEHTRYPAQVRFADAAGRTHTAETDVPPGLPAGGTVQVWSDRDGNLTGPPMTDQQILSRTIGAVATTGLVVALAGTAVHAVIGHALTRRCLTDWDRAWADTAPRWTAST